MRTTRSQPLHRVALAADLLRTPLITPSCLAITRTATWSRAVGLGLAAGIGALGSARAVGSRQSPRSERRANQVDDGCVLT